MNRDGYRAGRVTAEHEAAHAVIAILSGFAVGRVSIAPSRRDRNHLAGVTYTGRKIISRRSDRNVELAPITETAQLDLFVAGYAWELGPANLPERVAERGADSDLYNWISFSHERSIAQVLDAIEQFDTAADRVADWLAEDSVSGAVRTVADRLCRGKSGEIWGTTVERICTACGLTPFHGTVHRS